MQGHGAPAAADVEQPVALLEAELAADQFHLVVLGGLQGAALRPVGARVDHGRAEDECAEGVADVVVVADRPPVPPSGVQRPRRRRTSSAGGGGGGHGPASRSSSAAASRTRGSRTLGAVCGPSQTGPAIRSSASYRSPSTSRSPATQPLARPSSPGFHSSRRRARRWRTTRTGTSPPGGPASLPSQARTRRGSGTPVRSSASAASREAVSDMVHTSMTPSQEMLSTNENTPGRRKAVPKPREVAALRTPRPGAPRPRTPGSPGPRTLTFTPCARAARRSE